ncbi:MAG TPA: hypothetical protein PKC79_08185 [Solidesulfovibrio magneticus]|nr:hypothetical protein [Solidesulfovibrio magneticus]
MAEGSRQFGAGSLIAVFIVGMGLGWLVSSRQALLDRRASDGAGFEEVRQRFADESMRRLDLSPEQRRVYLEAWENGRRDFDLALGRMRPEIEGVLSRIDARVRPMLSPRQLAVYDRIEAERRAHMPERPAGGD